MYSLFVINCLIQKSNGMLKKLEILLTDDKYSRIKYTLTVVF